MLARLRAHLTYANVMATIAVFIALGGSSYAAVMLSRNSVKSSHIKNGQVKRPDLAANAIASSNVADGSLLRQDFAASEVLALTGATGAQGAKGDTGPQGERGDKGDPGTPAPEAWALYSGSSIQASEGVTSITQASIAGQYRVLFAEPVRNDCAILVSPGDWTTVVVNPDAANVGAPKQLNIAASGSLSEVTVAVHTSAGADTTGGFSIAAFC